MIFIFRVVFNINNVHKYCPLAALKKTVVGNGRSRFKTNNKVWSFVCLQVILTVYLNDTQQMLTEVPVTPATRVVDVVEYCKEAGEGECHLAEKWNGHGESVLGFLIP